MGGPGVFTTGFMEAQQCDNNTAAVSVRVWRGEHFSDGWSNMKISGSFNCSGLSEVHASVFQTVPSITSHLKVDATLRAGPKQLKSSSSLRCGHFIVKFSVAFWQIIFLLTLFETLELDLFEKCRCEHQKHFRVWVGHWVKLETNNHSFSSLR